MPDVASVTPFCVYGFSHLLTQTQNDIRGTDSSAPTQITAGARCANGDTEETLQAMGIADVFDKTADFSPILPQADGGYISAVEHAARVAIDEKGVTAAAYTVIDRCGAALAPKEEIYFTLDRPFLFYVESEDNLPLFAGIVNNP